MKKTLKRIVTCIFSTLLTVNAVMPTYANEQVVAEPSPTLNITVEGNGQVKVTENETETIVTKETPFTQSYKEGTKVTIEAIADEENVIENFTNNDVAVPEFVAEQNSLKIEYVTGVENSNFVVTFKEIVSSEEQETNEKVDTEPIEQPEAEGETTKEDSIETEEKDKTKDKVDKNSKLLINDETFIPNRPVSAEEQQILNDYQNGMTMKEEYIQKRKEIVDKIHAWKYVDDNYFITAKFYEDYDTANLLLGLGASILIAPDFRYSESASSTYSSDRSLSSPVVTYFEEGGHTSISNGIGTVWGTGGFWKVDGHVAFCGEAMFAPPRAGSALNSAVEVHDDRVRKVIYYAYGYPNNQVSNYFKNRDQSLLATNEFLSAVASGTSLGGSSNGQRYHVAYEMLKGILNLPSPPSDFKVYKAKCPGTGTNFQGIVTENQTLYWGQNEPKGNLTIEKSSSNPSITDNNNCYSLEGAEYGLYNSEADANKDVNRVGTFTIKADGKANTIKDLKAKTYYLKETKAGKGYDLDKKVYPVSVKSGKTEIKKVKDNPQADPVGILLKKRDKETGQDVPQRDAKLEGAEFTVKYYKGDYAEDVDPATQGATPERTWVLKTDEDGFTYLQDNYKVSGDEFYYNSTNLPTIPIGTVTLRETKAPEGYKLNDETFIVKVISEGSDEFLSTYQEPIVPEQVIKGKIRIAKKDKDTGKVIQVAGTVFDIYFNGQKVSSMTTDETGYATSEDLAYGEYVIKEAKAPNGYVVDVDQEAVVDITAEKTYDTEFKNSITKVEFSKIDATTSEELEGATQVVYPKDKPNEIFETWVSTKEPHIIKGLEVGQTYIWEEISAPYGFALAEKIEFTVEDTGEIQVAGTMKDEIVYGQLTFEKVGKQFTYTDIGMTDLGVVNTPVFEEMNILGAEITIYASEDITLGNGITYYKADEEIETLVSDFEAVQSIKLPVGKYYYVETKAPIGFVKNEEKHYFEVKDNQINELQVIESTLKNERPVYNINMTKQMEFSDTAMNKEAYKDVVFGIYTRDDTYDWKGNVAIKYDTLLATSGIDEEGHLVHTPELPVGNYYIKELATNSAYKLDEKEYDFSIEQSNDKAVIVPIKEGKPIINKLKEYYVLVNKVDENTMKNIISKEFEFTSFTDAECKNPIETKQANTKDGTVKFVLNYGTTYIKETKAPLGYSLSPEVVKVEVNDDGLFVNGKKVERSEDLLYSIIYKDSLLPVIQTGAGSDSMLFIVAGLGVLVSLIGILEYRRRNRNKKSENTSE